MISLLKLNGKQVVNNLFPALLCIVIVFVILTLIYLIIALMNKIKALDVKKQSHHDNKTEETKINMNEIDEDMMVAILVATIDFKNETKQDARLVRVNKIG